MARLGRASGFGARVLIPPPVPVPTLIPGNLLTLNQQDVETDLTGWNVSTGTMARVTNRSYTGVASIEITATSTPYCDVQSSLVTGLTPGDALRASWYALAQNVAGNAYVQFNWYTAGNAFIGQSNPTTLSGSSTLNAWTQVTTSSVTVPATADRVVVLLGALVTATGQKHNVDRVNVQATRVPSAPTPTGTDSTHVRVAWATTSGASTYDVQRDGMTIATGVTGTSYGDFGLLANTSYAYAVRAVGSGGTSAWSATATATTTAANGASNIFAATASNPAGDRTFDALTNYNDSTWAFRDTGVPSLTSVGGEVIEGTKSFKLLMSATQAGGVTADPVQSGGGNTPCSGNTVYAFRYEVRAITSGMVGALWGGYVEWQTAIGSVISSSNLTDVTIGDNVGGVYVVSGTATSPVTAAQVRLVLRVTGPVIGTNQYVTVDKVSIHAGTAASYPVSVLTRSTADGAAGTDALTRNALPLTRSAGDASAAADSLSGAIAVTLVAGNKLTLNQQDVETDLTGWAASTGTLVRVTNRAYSGSASMEVTATTNFLNVKTSPFVTGFSPGDVVTASWRAFAQTAARSADVIYNWYTAADVFISQSTPGIASGSSTLGAWGLVTANPSTAPATAAKLELAIGASGTAVGEKHNFDRVNVQAAPGRSLADGAAATDALTRNPVTLTPYIVQQASNQTSVDGQSLGVTLPSPPTRGNVGIVTAFNTGYQIAHLLSNKGFVKVMNEQTDSVGNTAIWVKVLDGSEQSLTMTPTSAVNVLMEIQYMEWAGLTGVSDVSLAVTEQNAASLFIGTSATTAVPNELVFAATGHAAPANLGSSWDSGFTKQFDGGSVNFRHQTAYKILRSTGTVSVTHSHTNTMYQNGGLASFAIGVAPQVRLLADNSAAADSLTRAAGASARAVADASAATDALVAAGARARPLADASAASDSLARALATQSRSLADASAASDSLVPTTVARIFRTPSDAAAATDAVSRALASQARPASDAAAASDSLAKVFGPTRAVSDFAAGTDSLARALASQLRALADASAGTDALARATARARTLSDGAGATDAATRAAVPLARALADAGAAADVLTRASAPTTRALSDASAAPDALARALALSRPLSDASLASDTLARSGVSPARSTSDGATAADTLPRATAAARAATDAALAGDTLTRALQAARATADAASAADTLTRTSVPAARSVADAASAADALGRTLAVPRAVADPALASDALSRPAAATARSLADAAAAADALSRLASAARATSDTALAADALSRAAQLPRAVSDTALAADALSRTTAGQARAAADAASAADALTALATQVIVPDVDVLATGWTDQLGGTTNLWSTINELGVDDTNYVTAVLV